MENQNTIELVELNHDLLTANYTKVYHEADFKYNAPHHFLVIDVDKSNDEEIEIIQTINFQEGPIKEVGINGVNNEDLIGMVLTRLEAFQNSPYACKENATAIEKLEEALMWLRRRTNKRVARNVEGTSEV